MINLTIDLDAGPVIAALNTLNRQIDNMQPAMEQIGDLLENQIRLGISEGHSPWGEIYAPLLNLRRNNRDPRVSDVPLNNTRQHIYNKITFNADHNSVIVGMNENAAIGITHQLGSTRKNIPARPFLPIRNNQVDLPSTWEQQILDIVNGYIAQAI